MRSTSTVPDIAWVEAAGNYVVLHTAVGELKLRETLSAMERELEPWDFVRVHRSHLVNLDAVREVQPWFHGDQRLVLTDGTELECFVFSRSSGGADALHCMFKGEEQTRNVPIDTIREIRFSGKDTAHGKSFERWIERYIEKKLAGETASIESESLDDDES